MQHLATFKPYFLMYCGHQIFIESIKTIIPKNARMNTIFINEKHNFLLWILSCISLYVQNKNLCL